LIVPQIGISEPCSRTIAKLRIGQLSNGSEVSIPVVIVNGKKESPTLWLNSGIHGDEVVGIVAARKIAFGLDPTEVNGRVIFSLIANPLAYQGRCRDTPLDNMNLGECFPGNIEGQITERMAYVLFNEIMDKAEYLIDMHSVSKFHHGKPYAVVKEHEDPQVSKVSEDMARMFGPPLYCKLDPRTAKNEPSPLAGSLDITCGLNKIPSFMAEVGEANRLDKANVKFATDGIVNIMKYLGILEGSPKKPESQIVLTSRKIVRCNCSGIALLEVEPQQFVRKGERIAVIVDVFGNIIESIEADTDLYVISQRYEPIVNIGDRIAFVGMQ
jgi:predicted deacylase